MASNHWETRDPNEYDNPLDRILCRLMSKPTKGPAALHPSAANSATSKAVERRAAKPKKRQREGPSSQQAELAELHKRRRGEAALLSLRDPEPSAEQRAAEPEVLRQASLRLRQAEIAEFCYVYDQPRHVYQRVRRAYYDFDSRGFMVGYSKELMVAIEAMAERLEMLHGPDWRARIKPMGRTRIVPGEIQLMSDGWRSQIDLRDFELGGRPLPELCIKHISN